MQVHTISRTLRIPFLLSEPYFNIFQPSASRHIHVTWLYSADVSEEERSFNPKRDNQLFRLYKL